MPLVQHVRPVHRFSESVGLGQADLGQGLDLLQPGRQRFPVQDGNHGPLAFRGYGHDDAGAAAALLTELASMAARTAAVNSDVDDVPPTSRVPRPSRRAVSNAN